jgi:hypothetical protein
MRLDELEWELASTNRDEFWDRAAVQIGPRSFDVMWVFRAAIDMGGHHQLGTYCFYKNGKYLYQPGDQTKVERCFDPIMAQALLYELLKDHPVTPEGNNT